MNTRTLIILTLILCLAGAGLWYRKQARTEAVQTRTVSLHRFAAPELTTDGITAVDMTAADNATLRLEKHGANWVISSLENVPASQDSVTRFLSKTLELEGELRPSDPADLTEYGLDDAHALRLTLRTGASDALRLLIGKADLRQAFVRVEGDTNVYVVPGSLTGQAGLRDGRPSAAFWVDTNLLSVEPADIQKLHVTTPDAEAILTRAAAQTAVANATAENTTVPAVQTPEWTFTALRGTLTQADLEKITGFLRRVSAAEVLRSDDPRLSALENAPYVLTVTTKTGTTTLRAAKKDKDILVRVDGAGHAYTLYDMTFESLFPKPEQPRQ